jgi:zinc and cadmium transporter
MSTGVLLTVYCASIILASIAGGSLPLLRRLTHIGLQIYLSFASGVMLGAALCHMLPEATALAPRQWSRWTLLGLLGLFFLERFFAFHHHEVPGSLGAPEPLHEEAGHSPYEPHAHGHSRLGWGAAVIGLSIHTLTGGFALASAVDADSGKPGWIGFGVFLATLLHKPADSLTITSLMVAEGTERRSAHLVNLLFSLVIPLGVALYWVTRGLVATSGADRFAGCALAFSAGTFLSIALGDLMPELQFHRHDRVKLSVALLTGVALMYASAMIER